MTPATRQRPGVDQHVGGADMKKTICSIVGCDRPFLARGLCGAHYKRMRNGKALDTPVRYRGPHRERCTIDGCSKPHHCRGLCAMHLDRLRHGRQLNEEPQILGIVKVACLNCKIQIVKTSPNHRYCQQCGAESLRMSYRIRSNARRSQIKNRDRIRYSLDEIVRRDGTKCHICHRKIDFRLPTGHRMAWTFDHLVPIALGGEDIPGNIGLAHSYCNKSKGARWIDQEHLF